MLNNSRNAIGEAEMTGMLSESGYLEAAHSQPTVRIRVHLEQKHAL